MKVTSSKYTFLARLILRFNIILFKPWSYICLTLFCISFITLQFPNFAVAGDKMNFKNLTLPSFAKTPCSPLNPKSFKDNYLDFNIPKELPWGDPLPVCALWISEQFKGMYLNTNITIQPKSHKEIYGISEDTALYYPSFEAKQTSAQLTKEGAPLYFNADAFNEYRRLPPGEYEVSLQAFGIPSIDSKKLTILAEGPRAEFSHKIVSRICKHGLIDDFKEYLDMQEKLSKVDLMDGESSKEMFSSLKQNAVQALAKHKEIFHSLDEKALRLLAKQESTTLAFYIITKIKSQCPKVKDKFKDNLMTHLLYILLSMEQQ